MISSQKPHYILLYKNGVLKKRVELLYEMLKECRICPRECGINRLKNERGFCKTGLNPIVASYNLHYGEEPPISGYQGSGTIFFTNCNLRCVFCQNYPISQLGAGKEVEINELAQMMIRLQKMGCHNINFVTPTHVIPQILKALLIATERGLNIPLVYNSGGYDRADTLQLLEGIIDIYMPDSKYSSDKMAEEYSSCPDYTTINKAALKEMWRQVGSLYVDAKNIAKKGMIVRHLVLPCRIAGTKEVLKMLAQEISKSVYISLMSQYFPANKAKEFPQINRRINHEEYKEALNCLHQEGLSEGWIQK